MVLIIGGAWQGKLSWAVDNYDLAASDLCDLAEGFVPDRRCYYHLEVLTRRNEEWPAFPTDAIIISREVGCGVVPMEAAARAWRERHGAALQTLATNADHVVRIFCGLSEVLK